MKQVTAQKQLCLLTYFEKFIQDSQKGRRLQPNGKRLSKGTITNYSYTLKLLQAFSAAKNFPLRIRPLRFLTQRDMEVEKNYWKKLHRQLAAYLYEECGHYDNYVGQCFKNIKVFIGYLNKELGIATGAFYKVLYVRKEDVPIFPLLPEELNYLISDPALETRLSSRLFEVKDFFVFGCTVALRVSDLLALQKSNLRILNQQYYLSVRSLKTAQASLIKLPPYAIAILQRHSGQKKWLLPRFTKSTLNKYIKVLLETAGFTQEVLVTRERRGVSQLQRNIKGAKQAFRFCDVASTHTMRRTGITILLSLGMTEQVVRKISGHAPHSKEFYRYVLWAQTYQDEESDKAFAQLAQKTLSKA